MDRRYDGSGCKDEHDGNKQSSVSSRLLTSLKRFGL
jgi:hypothetical protein